MSRDGGLRQLFATHMREAHWQAVETGSTGQGIPDHEYCFPNGRSGWIEYKLTDANAVNIRAEQVAWIERRVRVGGRVFIGVRRRCDAGVRRKARDELHIFRGAMARALMVHGLSGPVAEAWWPDGPAKWDWDDVRRIITA